MTKKKSLLQNKSILILLGLALFFRILCACLCQGFASDTACFYNWAQRLWTNGFAGFYSPDYFCDYPPGYLYVLRLLGGLFAAFDIHTISGASLLILKLPALLCDMVTGALIYKYACKHFTSGTAVFLSAIYLFHPAVFINSVIWGQVDSVFTLLVLLSCILLTENRPKPAYFLFALSILIKPQTLLFAPLILCNLAEQYLNRKPFKDILRNILGGILSLVMIVLLCLPFGLDKVISQYTDTLSSYPYAAVNAFNLWGLLGKNWASQDSMLGFLTYSQWGTLFIVAMTVISLIIFYKRRNHSDRYYVTGAFLVCSMFLFSVRMHERYLFPVMIMLLFTYIHNQEKEYLKSYGILSCCHFANVFWVLYYYDPSHYSAKSFGILSLSSFTVLGGLFLYRTIYLSAKGRLTSLTAHTGKASSAKLSGANALQKRRDTDFQLACPPQASRKPMGFTKVDFYLILGLSLFYGIFALTNLGVTKAPTTELSFPYNTFLELDAENGQSISHIYWYLLNEQDITCRLETKTSPDEDWTYVQDIELADVFEWEYITLAEPAASVRITNITENAVVGELVLTDANGDFVHVKQESDYAPLFDEKDTFPEAIDAQSTTIFDEIYYTRTVYEFMHGLRTYENTHPPLGKILITLGALLFGTTPFGFRFMGAFVGILMLPFLYLLGRNITRDRMLGSFIAFIFAFDFMHYTQTRIATIDVFITFFIILMYYFMEQYCSMSFYSTRLTKTFLPLGACGIAFGLGIATKWTGFYAGAGLAILFLLHLFKHFRAYQYALKHPLGSTDGINHSHIITHFWSYTWKTIGFCILFFVVIPATIYLLSYIPFVDIHNPGLWDRMWANQKLMLNYHSTLDATHPYSSTWYEWPTIVRPILYYSNTVGENLRQGISAFGNPLVWWAGIPAFLYTAYLAIYQKKETAQFLAIGYLAQYLPWVLVSRCTFIYHYFPSVPFVALMIGYSFLQLKLHLRPKTYQRTIVVYAVAVFILFLLFYPVLTGTTVNKDYVVDFLRLVDGWVLVR